MEGMYIYNHIIQHGRSFDHHGQHIVKTVSFYQPMSYNDELKYKIQFCFRIDFVHNGLILIRIVRSVFWVQR